MRAVWSFWSKPMKTNKSWAWLTQKHHLLSWILSVETARKHFQELSLVTDDEGAKMIVEGIGLEFDHLSLDLNSLDNHDPSWWVLGKLYAYRAQESPFVHIDNDVFIWNSLPERMLTSPLLAQNPEYFIVGYPSSYYKPKKVERLIGQVKDGWIPEEWLWSRSVFRHHQKAISCGILGGNNTDFINYYADLAIKLVEHPPNQIPLSKLKNKSIHVILLEQYLLSACIDYHKHRSESSYFNIDIEYLFPSLGDFYNAEKVGYTHLVAKTKKDPSITSRLERRVKEDYPRYYENCIRYLSKILN